MFYAHTLSDFARRYCEERPISRDYAVRLKKRAAALEQHCGEALLASVFTEANLNCFLRSLGDLSPWTIRCYARDLLVLWRAAADGDLVPYPITRRIYRPRCGELLIDAYTIEEARRLLHTAEKLSGVYRNGVAKSDYWPAAIRAAWDTGLRRFDVWHLNRERFSADGVSRLIQHKTQRAVTVRLRPETIAALDRIGGTLPLRWPLTPSRFGRHFKRIVKSSGVNRGSFRWIRRSSGSYVEAQQPGSGHKHLGHSCPAIFTKHYDARLMGSTLPQPPEL